MRLITRSDFDGLVCAALLEEIGIIDDYKFVHPKDVQDGNVSVSHNDVLANVPYMLGCGLWFDHHASEADRFNIDETFRYDGQTCPAPSCARVIYDYYGGEKKFAKFDQSGLMAAVDAYDSADLTAEDILKPKGWILLAFIMDPRTNLGRQGEYRISIHELMSTLITCCRTMHIEDILKLEDVKQRVNDYFAQEQAYALMMRRSCKVDKNVIVIDLRAVDSMPSGNRFIEYALCPDQNVSLRCFWGKNRRNIVFSVGHSIVTRTCKTDVGRMLLAYGGGGHRRVGTCQVAIEDADRVLSEMLHTLHTNG